MNSKYPYIERDESWMYFNKRLLLEAGRSDVPLLERLNFLGIYSNNLDEFFRVRVASLRRIAEYSGNIPRNTRKRAEHTLHAISSLNTCYSRLFEKTFDDLSVELEKEHIHIINETQLNEHQKEQVLSFYMNQFNGSSNPVFVESMTFNKDYHLKETLYLAVEAGRINKHEEVKGKELAIIEIPVKEFGRFIRLPDEAGECYLMFIDDVMRFCLPYIFTGMDFDHFTAYNFKFTKDAEVEFEGDLQSSVLEKVSQGIKKRKQALAVRMVYDHNMPKRIQERLMNKAGLEKSDMRIAGGRYHNLRDLMSFPDCGRSDLKFEPQPPLFMDKVQYSESMLHRILEKDCGFHFPYMNFDHFLRVLREAAISKEVTSIKISLYRLAPNSKVIKALMAAAQNGKRVTAVVELMARFDEASNINWSKKMKEAGVNVVFGPESLKIHSKMVHISTEHGDIACIGTGNLHEGTARVYTDYMMMTHHKGIVSDVNKVFHYIERPFINFKFKELLVSPNEMRRKFYALINKEIKNKKEGKDAYILIKINHIVDESMVRKLYEASTAGVRIELCLRGNCSIVPGVKGVSENIFINAIIDRYLEHSRIFIFCNEGNEKYFLGSADWMNRNLDRRIEVISPVYDSDIKCQLKRIVESGLRDTSQGHYVNCNKGEPRRLTAPKPLYRSQKDLYEYYKTILND
ncbi:RNA degradosome polyphosphate kinase [Porphyromonas pogonae]|uniref:RNA degradosome polyphosphate kinase n=1 Tax=Porphyromonas pogonae TaxID=867595 RepID=UPI002E79E57F|nr:RNA degradosome polyphosphate kinase [Porphyromonas pogonae]